ncbi:MAG: site-specific integrase [Proteobacteria bacterium]|nr:site-specific integrase [Pseudomonadota bacterium]
MRLDFATDSFVFGGCPRPGFPLLTGDNFKPLEPFHSFLVYKLLEEGTPFKRLSQRTYGERLWDYASFLHGQDLQWDVDCASPGQGPVIYYRDWLRSPGQNVGASTANDRLRIVIEMYKWAHKTGRIQALPFNVQDTSPTREESAYEHYPQARSRTGPLLSEYEAPLAFLTKPQVAAVRDAQLHPTHRLMFEMAGRTGMRSSEIRTFPTKYVFDPRAQPGLSPTGVVRVGLSPQDMELKFNKGRIIEIPCSLMTQMHVYKTCYRDALAGHSPGAASLLLTARGHPFGKDAVVEAFTALSKASGIYVRAHLMRHSFAIHFLLALRNAPDYRGNPLEHLMTQLGHSNIQSVMVYLRHIGIADNATNVAIQTQLDDIFAT